LRNIFLADASSYRSNKLRGESVIDLLDLVIAELKNKVFVDNVTAVGNIQLSDFFSQREQLEKELFHFNSESIQKLSDLLSKTSQVNSAVSSQFSPPKSLDYYNTEMRKVGSMYLPRLKDIANLNDKLINVKRYYIPIIRGMRPFDKEQVDIYLNRTLDDYFYNTLKQTANSKSIIFTGIALYKELKKHLLGEPEERELIKKYEDFLSKTFFHNQQVALIPKIDSDTVYIKIVITIYLQLANMLTNHFMIHKACDFFK